MFMSSLTGWDWFGVVFVLFIIASPVLLLVLSVFPTTPLWPEVHGNRMTENTKEIGQRLSKTMPNGRWIEHAYPLQQITIQLQGTRHSSRSDVVDQLEAVLARLKNGELDGIAHDDDFGYRFKVQTASPGPSFFDDPAGGI
jgi:hypothetical protein